MKKFKAVLFDFDGVIGKTMEDNFSAWEHALAKYGIDITKTEYFMLEGVNTHLLAKEFLEKNGKDTAEAWKVVKLKEEYYFANNHFSLYDGVEDVISDLKKNGYLLAIVTAANSERLFKTLKPGLIRNFDSVITGDKKLKSKPDPEPYLSAAKELKLKPEECVVIENAPIGIAAAKNAGMYCIAVASTLGPEHLSKADVIVNYVKEIRNHLTLD